MQTDDLLRKMQLAELKMLKETINFFEKNDLSYFAIGGTLLGAVRHKGFIPWDDDIDLGLPREDYDRMLQLAKEGKCPLKLTGPWENDPACYWFPARVESTDTKVRRFVHEQEVEQYIWIDLFPIDGLPAGKLTQKFYWWKVSFHRLRFNLSRLQKYEASESASRNALKKFLILFMNPKKMDREKEFRKYDAVMKKYGFKGRPYFLNAEGRCAMREIAPQEWIGKKYTLPFEDIEICCIENYDKYLTQIYGDYMQPPKNPNVYEHNIRELIITENDNC